MPLAFDVPLAPHHRLIGRWLAGRQDSAQTLTRPEARRQIEQAFNAAVIEALQGCELTDLRVVALHGDGELPPALAVICDSVGQIDLGWIEKTNVLAHTLKGSVAPVGWRAAAYRAVAEGLTGVLPVFGYDELFEEIAAWYWDGETDDDGALKALKFLHGDELSDIDDLVLPSTMNGLRPDFMLAENAAALREMPAALQARLRRVRAARAGLQGMRVDGNAWHFDFNAIVDYIPEFEDASHLPPLTIVPVEQFMREIDEVARHGMEVGFMDVAGLCPLTDVTMIDAWFTTLRLGAELLRAVQDLIDIDPTERGDAR